MLMERLVLNLQSKLERTEVGVVKKLAAHGYVPAATVMRLVKKANPLILVGLKQFKSLDIE
jgi:vacuolar-type H+-ATPase subunit I/STV1